MSEYLSPVEMHTLTGYARSGQQGDWLKEHSIPHRQDGKRVIVSREHVREAQYAEEMLSLLSGEIDQYIVRPDTQRFERATYPTNGEFAGIYILFDGDGYLNYVGQSVGVGYRNLQHHWSVGTKQRRPFTEYAALEVPDLLRLNLEIAHIYALEPPENGMPRVQWDRHDEAVKLIKEAWGIEQ